MHRRLETSLNAAPFDLSAFGPWCRDIGPGECRSRARELRAIFLLRFGATHPLTLTMTLVEQSHGATQDEALNAAAAVLGRLPVHVRQDIFRTYGVLRASAEQAPQQRLAAAGFAQ